MAQAQSPGPIHLSSPPRPSHTPPRSHSPSNKSTMHSNQNTPQRAHPQQGRRDVSNASNASNNSTGSNGKFDMNGSMNVVDEMDLNDFSNGIMGDGDFPMHMMEGMGGMDMGMGMNMSGMGMNIIDVDGMDMEVNGHGNHGESNGVSADGQQNGINGMHGTGEDMEMGDEVMMRMSSPPSGGVFDLEDEDNLNTGEDNGDESGGNGAPPDSAGSNAGSNSGAFQWNKNEYTAAMRAHQLEQAKNRQAERDAAEAAAAAQGVAVSDQTHDASGNAIASSSNAGPVAPKTPVKVKRSPSTEESGIPPVPATPQNQVQTQPQNRNVSTPTTASASRPKHKTQRAPSNSDEANSGRDEVMSPEGGKKNGGGIGLGQAGAGRSALGVGTPRPRAVTGKKRTRDEEEPSSTHSSDLEKEREQVKRAPTMIFKNAFGASDVEGDDDDDDEDMPASHKAKRAKTTDGQAGGFEMVDKDGESSRRKIRIEYIADKSRRHITFSKRKAGIMKKAYELSTLTGTQVLLLVVSETGLVYTFTTAKLQPLVTKAEGKNLIQSCLNAPDPSAVDGDAGESSAAPAHAPSSSKKDRSGLAIRPLKLNAEESGKLAASAASAIPVPPIPEDSTPRPRKRLPSGKAKKPTKKDQQALRDAQAGADGTGNPLSEGNNPASESDTQAVDVPDSMHHHRDFSATGSGHDLQAAQNQHMMHAPPMSAGYAQPMQQQAAQQQHHHQMPQEYHQSSARSSMASHPPPQYYGHPPAHHHQGHANMTPSQAMLGMQPTYPQYGNPPTHAPPQYLSGVHQNMSGPQGYDPNHFNDHNGYGQHHQTGMAM